MPSVGGDRDHVLLSLADADLGPPGRMHPILTGVSLELFRGDVAVILGKNGSGKSTLLKSLAGLWPLRRGTLYPPAPRGFDSRRAGLVLDDPPSELVSANVTREVEFGLENLGVDMASATARRDVVLDLFDLGGLRSADPQHLSPGEQERVLLAATLAPDPPILLLDDPFLYLSPKEMWSAWRRTVEAAQEGRVGALLLATHDVDLALSCRTAGRLDRGGLVAWGDAAEVVGDALRGGLL
jgi:energy-coupling factor transporter ATP-binding protein EcfA2